MEVAESPAPRSGAPRPAARCADREGQRKQVRVTRTAVLAMLEQCQRTLDLLKNADPTFLGLEEPIGEEEELEEKEKQRSMFRSGESRESPPAQLSSSSSMADESETDELCELLKSRVDSPDFLEKLGSIHASVCHNLSDESISWDIVAATDIWEVESCGEHDLSQEDYVLVKKEDIVDGIACFMAAYLLSLKQTKDLTPNELQKALSKTFSANKKKGKLRRAWDGSRVLYNVASWSATAVGIYQNPALLKAASTAIWTSCRAISKFF